MKGQDMFVLMDREEILSFKTPQEIATYLGQTAASGYAEKVLKWVESTEQSLFIANGPLSNDIWYKK